MTNRVHFLRICQCYFFIQIINSVVYRKRPRVMIDLKQSTTRVYFRFYKTIAAFAAAGLNEEQGNFSCIGFKN